MPTINDLRAAFDELANLAPARTSAAAPPSRRAHRVVAVGLAAACTAAVALVLPLSVHDSPDQRRTTVGSSPHSSSRPTVSSASAFDHALPAPRAGRSPQLAYGFDVSPVAGYRVRPASIGRTHQAADVSSTDRRVHGQLNIYYAGAFDPGQAQRGTPVTVHGRPGFRARVAMPDDPSTRVDALIWQYADHGWALVYLWDKSSGRHVDATGKGQPAPTSELSGRLQQDELAIAEATQAGSASVSVPFRLDASAGVYVDSLSVGVNGGLGLDHGAAPSADGLGNAWTIGWSPSRLNAADKPDTSTITAHGQRWIVYAGRSGTILSLGLIADGFGMTVTPAAGRTLTLAQFREFVGHLTIASRPADRATWFGADRALP